MSQLEVRPGGTTTSSGPRPGTALARPGDNSALAIASRFTRRVSNAVSGGGPGASSGNSGADARFSMLEDQRVMLTLFLHRVARDGPTTQAGLSLLNTLTSFGADVNAVDRFKHSALYLAVKRGHLDTVKRLLTLKASVESADSAGMSPLAIAAYLGNKNMCAT